MRLTQQLLSILSEDAGQIEQMLDKNLKLDDVGVTTQQAGTRVLAAATTDAAIDFGGVTSAKYILIVAYDAVQFRLNDVGSQLLDLTPIPAVTTTVISQTQKQAQPAQLFLGPSNITSLFLTNPNPTETARVFVALIGETV